MSWQQLLNITKEARQIHAEEKAKQIIECPFDGSILESNGVWLNCPMGNYRVRVGATHGSD